MMSFQYQMDIFHDILGKRLENIEANTQKKVFKTFSKMFSKGFQNIYMTSFGLFFVDWVQTQQSIPHKTKFPLPLSTVGGIKLVLCVCLCVCSFCGWPRAAVGLL